MYGIFMEKCFTGYNIIASVSVKFTYICIKHYFVNRSGNGMFQNHIFYSKYDCSYIVLRVTEMHTQTYMKLRVGITYEKPSVDKSLSFKWCHRFMQRCHKFISFGCRKIYLQIQPLLSGYKFLFNHDCAQMVRCIH